MSPRRVGSPPRGLPKRRSQSSGHSPGALRPLRDDPGAGPAVRGSPSTPPQGLSRFARRTVSAPGSGIGAFPSLAPARQRPAAHGHLGEPQPPSGAARSPPLRSGGRRGSDLGASGGAGGSPAGVGGDPLRRVLGLGGPDEGRNSGT